MVRSVAGRSHIVVFKNEQIRRVFIEDAWWFVVADVVQVLTDTADASQYVKRMRSRDKDLAAIWKDLVKPQLIETDGGSQKLNCANTEGLFRIVQSISSSKAEPFKRWLAKIGYERVQEIEDPELASKRARDLYKSKGYDDAWIEKRMRGIQVRAELTDEWKKREVGYSREFGILTAEISKATFGMTPTEYKQYKRLDRENLRDHMNDLELIFTMLGEASATEIAREDDALGFDDNYAAARSGGEVAGNARKDLETRTGNKVITTQNYLDQTQKQMKQKK